jgi:hypothetical protein
MLWTSVDTILLFSLLGCLGTEEGRSGQRAAYFVRKGKGFWRL